MRPEWPHNLRSKKDASDAGAAKMASAGCGGGTAAQFKERT
jgi:hypothetical protein